MSPQSNLVCPVCGKDFHRRPSQQAQSHPGTCSMACRRAGERARSEAPCAVCGKPVYRSPHQQATTEVVTCSHACKAVQQSRSVNLVCAVCGKTFPSKPSRVPQRDAPTCSRACQRAAQRANSEVPCVVCGKVVYRAPSQRAKVKVVTCSHACKAARREPARPRALSDLTCPICGKTFYRSPALRKSATLYCSQSCAYVGIRRNRQGATPDLRICARCGESKPVADYHVDRSRQDGLSIYCRPCAQVRNLESRTRHGDERRERQRTRNREWREELIAAYGGKCVCCGESHPEFLTIDHVNGDGAAHRRTIKTPNMTQWLRKAGYPQDGFRLLCFNCNCSRGFLGYCPHEETTSPAT
jgi:hypothetical protein